ncbi:hypothetical protein K1W54_20455 [Micromonospora sp. CPCC 205371]|nr:hypothetical protein [Micromonospora sp. CPCC 205371]
MTNAAKHTRPAGPTTARATPSRTGSPVSRDGPPTNVTWAWSVRRFGRVLMWTLPAYAVLFGGVTFGRMDGGGPAPYLANGRLLHLIGWVVATWLGLVALLAIACLLAAARSRRSAAAGLLIGLTGMALLLPFAALPPDTAVYGWDARRLSLVGAGVYSLGWVLAGWAVARSKLFSKGDGLLLMMAGPMLGVGGLLVGPLQTVGAIFVLAAGIGMAWTAGHLVPAPRRDATAEAGPAGGGRAGGAPRAGHPLTR